jgi:hypothetical protein
VTRALTGWAAAMGPVEPLDRAAASLHWARRALGLAERGIIDGRRELVRCDEHLATLLIFADEELAAALRAARTCSATSSAIRTAGSSSKLPCALAGCCNVQSADRSREPLRAAQTRVNALIIHYLTSRSWTVTFGDP